MLTAATITDEQIREWERDMCATCTGSEKRTAVDLATEALADRPSYADGSVKEIGELITRRRRARARIAESINAREASEAVR